MKRTNLRGVGCGSYLGNVAKLGEITITLTAVLALTASHAYSWDWPRSKNNPAQQQQPATGRGELYRSIDGYHAVTLISSSDLELRDGDTTYLCKFTKQDGALRVIATVRGSNQVLYYRLTDSGLEKDGTVLLSPAAYAAAVEQIHAARQRQEEAQRAEELARKQAETARQVAQQVELARLEKIRAGSRAPTKALNRFITKEGSQIVLTDTNVTFAGYDPGGSRPVENVTLWYGDVRWMEGRIGETGGFVRATYLTGYMDFSYNFARSAEAEAFRAALHSAIIEWRKRFPEITRPFRGPFGAADIKEYQGALPEL